MEGRRLGRYQITSKLAEGGMGAVYLATHELMGREVVIKVLLPEMSTQRDIVQRFFNEARATGNLNHPGIVAIFDLDYADDARAYIVMERLQGETLDQRLRRVKRLSVEHTLDVTRQLASALAAAHGNGIVHRDLKPGNIFLVPDPETPGRERVKVLDFGVAKLAMQQTSLVTLAGAIVGTAAYMAPEQCKDATSVDHRADLYALGCIVYKCLCGRSPFLGSTIEVLASQLRDIPAAPREMNALVPPWLDSLVMRLLEKKPDNRIQSCAALIETLDRSTGMALRAVRPGTDATNYQNNDTPAEPAPARLRAETAEQRSGLDALTERIPGQTTSDLDVARTSDTERISTRTAHSAAGSLANSAAELRASQGGHKRRVWLGVASALMVLAGVSLYLGLDGAGTGSSTAQPPNELQVLTPIAAELPPAGSTQTPVDAMVDGRGQDQRDDSADEQAQTASMATDEAVQALVAEAREAQKNKAWALAAAKAQQALQLAPGHPAATETLEVAEQEQVHAQRFREFEDALEERDFKKAQAKLAALPETSVYHQPAKAKLSRARDKHKAALRDAIALAERWRDAGKCGDIEGLQAAWFEIDQEFQALIEQCKAVQKQASSRAVSSGNTARNTPRSVEPAKSEPVKSARTGEKPASSDRTFSQLLSQAQEAAKRSLYGEAHRLCREALAIQPRDPRAIEVCTTAACNIGNAAVAKGYYVQLPKPRQSPLHRLCLAKGIDLAR